MELPGRPLVFSGRLPWRVINDVVILKKNLPI
jgi:hypothetical protein